MTYKKVDGIYENEYDARAEIHKMWVTARRIGNEMTVRISDDETGIAMTATFEEESNAKDKMRTHGKI